MTKKVLVYTEIINRKVAKVSKEIIAYALQNFSDSEIYAVTICDENTANNTIDDIKHLGATAVYILQDNLFDQHNTCVFAHALANFILDFQPDVLLMGATSDGRDLAPRLASKLNIGLTADCTALEINEEGKLLATRPTYGGKLMAVISSKTTPNFATVRPGAFKLPSESFSESEMITISPNIDGLCRLVEVISTENKPPVEDWTCVEIIVAGGLGLNSKENFDLIYKLADKLGAKPAASRPAVERGWAPQTIQVGQTGSSISPKLYIAFGISGAMQHLVGITNADKIIAVNTDKKAPIMQSADIAIVGDAVSVLNMMIEQ